MSALPRRLLSPLFFLGLVFAAALPPGCAPPVETCQRNSDCGRRRACRFGVCGADCVVDRDCPAERPTCDINGLCASGTPTDAGPDTTQPLPDVPPPRPDAAIDVAMDRAMMPVDVPMTMDVPPRPDVIVPPPDVMAPPPDVVVVGTGAYLDRCTADTDCSSGVCGTELPRFCTRTCTTDSGCAGGQLCVRGICRHDDTGTTGCSPTTAAPCLLSCIGTAGAAHCTHNCATAADCPSGYACSPVTSSQRVCVDIERPCTTADQCPSSLGFCGGAGAIGCTARCTTAADCPSRLPGLGLPPYTCEVRSGMSVCVPPSDVVGPDSAGSACSATGSNTCRSGACESGPPPVCVQNCTVRGGCAAGQGCYPDLDPTATQQYCRAAGSRWLDETCTRASECRTALCLPTGPGATSGYCTRNCSDDSACPTGMTCRGSGARTPSGADVRLCQR